MPIRNSVRDRRRERIQQLLDDMQANEDPVEARPEARERASIPPEPPITEDVLPPVIQPSYPSHGLVPMSPIMPSDEPDPELWWKEKQRTMKYDTNNWAGMKGLSPTSRAPDRNRAPGRSGLSPWARGMAVRIFIAGLLFAGAWGWLKYELPGSAEARAWMTDSVSNDMDFQAIEAWYSDTFGGSPSFLPFLREGDDTKEVAVTLNPEDTVVPVQGRIVQSYAQSGSGVKLAAPAGSDIVAVYAGRVLQVQAEEAGGLTILVQHPDSILSVYGNLQRATVKENDWVEAGEKLGELKSANGADGESTLYFAVQQNGKKLDPAEVVPFD
ncbi:peptidoglycan DD-metalloendopeptidase family protein [Cohnella yongneupensis]|uniref:Peptidoglycan DD-metalloendopeptidase family protein n=1 Tax=Cohnella yongneupensis TaxID=425006 RepID=A0ABW0R0B0_9BACL